MALINVIIPDNNKFSYSVINCFYIFIAAKKLRTNKVANYIVTLNGRKSFSISFKLVAR